MRLSTYIKHRSLHLEKFSYLNRSNLEYIEQQYQNFLKDPQSIEGEWRMFFEGVEFAQSLTKTGDSLSTKEIDVYNLIQYYRDYGHLKANLDPLRLAKPVSDNFDLKNFNLSEKDLNQKFQVGSIIGLANSPLKDIISKLEKIYCNTLTPHVAGCEPRIRTWFHKEFEQSEPVLKLSKELKKGIFESLAKTESLEKFIHTRYVGTKRFSVEGGDALLPMLERAVLSGTPLGVKELVIGMAHRGRVNVLANFMDKAVEVIFSEFEGNTIDSTEYDGDVKYHMGYSSDKQTPHGPCHISLAFNPSHLEAVNPVVCGMTRAKQRRNKDTEERKTVIAIQIHGDAAVIGQGVVAETLQLSQLKGYTTGGSIHIVINNQVGFTTNPVDSRSTRYSSDISKTIKAPVLLVNGDDVEACVRAMDMAVRFRQEFKQDIFIDKICYRRFGHNEGDEPAFTQPLMYDAIKKHPPILKKYTEKIVAEGVIDEEFAKSFYQQKIDNLQIILDGVRKSPPTIKPIAFDGLWKGLRRGTADDFTKTTNTTIDKKILLKLSEYLTKEPGEIQLHPKIQKLIASREQMVESNRLDWAMGELLSYASLVYEGHSVRLSGQDCKRGTFTHRQAVYFDTKTNEEYCPLKQINPDKEFCIYNSSLSELAVVGYEYGNSSSDPTFLTVWEAQFGDFSNGAQIIIDQFLCSGEQKWARMNGLCLLLPHGYEGQGPEHSSARLERYLQLCAQENMQVCNLTTPANLFHAFRRQMKRDFRKPLVIMSPKSLLRHPDVVSSMEELAEGRFKEVIVDPRLADMSSVETLFLCSGKIYYDIDKERVSNPTKKAALVRVEQLYPLPKAQLASLINAAPKLKNLVWVQEEPQNMGSWHYIMPQLMTLLDDLGVKKVQPKYIGRTFRASPAVGSPKVHQKEQAEIVNKVLQYF
ncbi:MAG: 2-oxoglutarate dehydrogenase E1 component [Bdellovibrionaceae bacterium]|nr:2-oxoglutarate dehydrogenase E1 component [Pseudobdellovibrionaceae bacterium]